MRARSTVWMPCALALAALCAPGCFDAPEQPVVRVTVTGVGATGAAMFGRDAVAVYVYLRPAAAPDADVVEVARAAYWDAEQDRFAFDVMVPAVAYVAVRAEVVVEHLACPTGTTRDHVVLGTGAVPWMVRPVGERAAAVLIPVTRAEAPVCP